MWLVSYKASNVKSPEAFQRPYNESNVRGSFRLYLILFCYKLFARLGSDFSMFELRYRLWGFSRVQKLTGAKALAMPCFKAEERVQQPRRQLNKNCSSKGRIDNSFAESHHLRIKTLVAQCGALDGHYKQQIIVNRDHLRMNYQPEYMAAIKRIWWLLRQTIFCHCLKFLKNLDKKNQSVSKTMQILQIYRHCCVMMELGGLRASI